MSPPPIRGRRGKARRMGEAIEAAGAARRAVNLAATRPIDDVERDLDAIGVDAELEAREVADSIRARRTGTTGRRTEPFVGPVGRGAGRRVPDLSGLPLLLVGTGAFGDLRARLGDAAQGASARGRHAGVTSVPHGAKSYLAAALALAPEGARLCWIARDAEIGDRVAEEFQAWLGDADLVAVLEPRTALAYERSELVADETAARVAALASWRSGRARVLVASVQALLQHTIEPADLPADPLRLRVGERRTQAALLAALLDLGYVPTIEVAGRGEFARRGGLVDIFPPSAPLPVRIEFFGDEIDSIRAFDPTDQRSTGPVDDVALLPASEFLRPPAGTANLAVRLGARATARLGERLAADFERLGRDDVAGSTRAVDVGDAAEVWAPYLAPATGLDHIDPGTLIVLDEPGDIAEAATFLWRQADERRGELVAAGDLPRDWPATYLGPRDW